MGVAGRVRCSFRWWAVPVFWVHHGLLTVVPWFLLLTRAFHVEPAQFNLFWFPFAFCLWGLYFFNVQQTTALFFNTIGRTWWTDTEEICNVNYMIFPPPVAGAVVVPRYFSPLLLGSCVFVRSFFIMISQCDVAQIFCKLGGTRST